MWLDVLVVTLQLFGLLTALSIVVLSLVWLERKFLGRIQRRMGPMRVGFHGLLQPVADAVKLVLKEDVVPGWADKAIFWVAPLIVFVPAFMIWITIPFAGDIVLRNMDMGLLFIIAFSVLGIAGLVLAGWSSASKYAVLGSLRAAAQLVSYEIPIIMAVIAVAMLPQSMNLVTIVEAQHPVPYAVLQPLGLAIFLVAGIAEVGRTPFDIYFAESEVVGGPFVEYSGAHWAVFFLAEYISHLYYSYPGGYSLPGWMGLTPDARHLVAGPPLGNSQDVPGSVRHLLVPGNVPPVEGGPAHVLRLEDADPSLLCKHWHYRCVPVLRLAVVELDAHVPDDNAGNGVCYLPAADLASQSHGGGASGTSQGIPANGGVICWVA